MSAEITSCRKGWKIEAPSGFVKMSAAEIAPEDAEMASKVSQELGFEAASLAELVERLEAVHASRWAEGGFASAAEALASLEQALAAARERGARLARRRDEL